MPWSWWSWLSEKKIIVNPPKHLQLQQVRPESKSSPPHCYSLLGLDLAQTETSKTNTLEIPWSPEVFDSPRQILTLLNKVPGYWLQGETDLASKPRKMQIFPHSKFGIDRTAGLKVMAKKFLRPKLYFLAITFEAAHTYLRLNLAGEFSNFEGRFEHFWAQICSKFQLYAILESI